MTELPDTPLWHPLAHMPSVRGGEVVLVRGEKAYVWDSYGRRRLDAPASLWYCNIGHGRAEMAEAIAAQIRRLEAYSTFQQYATPPALELAERIVAMSPIENAKVFFTSGGSDAVDTAAKLARRYWNALGEPRRRFLVAREGAYHGLHGFGTSIAGLAVNRDGYGDLLPDAVTIDADDPGALERLVDTHGADAIAAFFCEPVIGAGGVLFPAPGYLEAVGEICRSHGIVFVVDEVITGFGRTGAPFACDRWGLRPDILLVAKGITSGYLPLGAAVVGERLWEPFWRPGSELSFRHGVTYAGHATACAAAMANLDIIEREHLVDRVRELEPYLERTLRPLEAHDLVREVRTGAGLLAGIELVTADIAETVAATCLEHGVLARVLARGTLQISPPFVVTEADLDFLTASLAYALDEVARAANEIPA